METGWRKNYIRYKSFFLNTMAQYRERSDWRAYLEILLSLTTVSVFSIFALRPTILTIAELIQQIEEKEETVAKMDAKIQNIGKAQTLYDREGPNINLLRSFVIPERPNSDIFARQIEGLASKHQLAISTITLGEAEIFNSSPEKPLPESENLPLNEDDNEPAKELSESMDYSISIDLGVTQYPPAFNLISDFENLRVLSKLEKMQFSVKEQDLTDERELNLILEGKIPYLKTQF